MRQQGRKASQQDLTSETHRVTPNSSAPTPTEEKERKKAEGGEIGRKGMPMQKDKKTVIFLLHMSNPKTVR